MLRVVMTPSKSYSSLHLIHSTKENHKASNSIEKSSNPFGTIEQFCSMYQITHYPFHNFAQDICIRKYSNFSLLE